MLNPNANSVTLPEDVDISIVKTVLSAVAKGAPVSPEAAKAMTAPAKSKKVAIEDSKSPEEHTMGVWENMVSPLLLSVLPVMPSGWGRPRFCPQATSNGSSLQRI